MEARRRRVPAFGEWNYYYYSGELATPAAAAELYEPAPELDTRSEVWFKYSLPPRKPPPRKVRKPEMDKSYNSGGKRRHHHATPARVSDVGAPTAAQTTVKAATARVRVVRSVDADLYQVPSPGFSPDEPRRRKKASSRRSVWMGCFGFGCVD